ncbi:MAG: hypothetical protein IJE19_01350 [Clostridia bacterium]|nr:hypothetical protein [Clostridia bacterium]
MKIKKIISIILFELLLFSSCSSNQNIDLPQQNNEYSQPIFNEKAENVIKTETVYVNLGSSGNLKKITVTDWLHAEKSGVYIDDVSVLDNIKNIKGNSLPQRENGILRWHMDENDLYYTGTTNKTPPVLFSVEYFLNGNAIDPEELAGKSGDVVLRIKIRNNLFKEIFINGERYTVSLPTVAAGGIILPGDIFTDVEVRNAQSFNDGSKQLVAFATLPGINESLGFNSNSTDGFTDMLTAEEIVLKAKAENFSLENIYFAVLPLASLNFDLAMPESVDDVGAAISAIKAFRDSVQKLDPDRIIYSLISDEKKMSTLLGAVNDASVLYDENRNLIELAGKYSTPENIAVIQRLIEVLNTPEVKAMLEVISDPEVQSFITGLPIIMDNFGDIEPLLSELQKDLSRPEVQAELSDLTQTVEKLSEITKVISENEREIDAIFSALDGNGGQSLEALLESINPEDFELLEDKYSNVVEDSETIAALAEEWLKFGSEYGLFSGKAEDMSVSLMFIYKTDVIRPAIS